MSEAKRQAFAGPHGALRGHHATLPDSHAAILLYRPSPSRAVTASLRPAVNRLFTAGGNRLFTAGGNRLFSSPGGNRRSYSAPGLAVTAQ